jgi:iron complex transport system permease protein
MRMKLDRYSHQTVYLLFSFLLLIILFVMHLAIGKVQIPLLETLKILLTQQSTQPGWSNIIWQFRVPKAIAASLAGAALAVSGLQLQTLFQNPLAGPFTLGISSGASLGVAIVVLAAETVQDINLAQFGSWTTVIAACLGAFGVTAIVLLASQRVKNGTALLILGLMFGYGTGAIVNILLQISSAQQVQQFVIWTFGSFGGVTWAQLPVMTIGLGLGLVLATLMTTRLNAMILGEMQATSLGVNIQSVRLGVLLSASLLAGVVTAFCGPIAFIGVSVPHLARGFLRTADLRWLLPGVMTLGVSLALVADWVSQMLLPRSVLPLNAVTALMGTPLITWIILRQARSTN